jgi:hypothetical protein
MPICPICDDTGLQNSDSENPQFCYCAAGKQSRRQSEANRSANRQGKNAPRSASFIDIANLEQVNASVDAMRASLLGSGVEPASAPAKHPSVQLLYQVAHAGHEVSVVEATQLYDLAKALEGFLGGLPTGRGGKR